MKTGQRTLQVEVAARALRRDKSEERKKFAYFYLIVFKDKYMRYYRFQVQVA